MQTEVSKNEDPKFSKPRIKRKIEALLSNQF